MSSTEELNVDVTDQVYNKLTEHQKLEVTTKTLFTMAKLGHTHFDTEAVSDGKRHKLTVELTNYEVTDE